MNMRHKCRMLLLLKALWLSLRVNNLKIFYNFIKIWGDCLGEGVEGNRK